jgi:excisionase family DNA binding protein
MKTMQSENKIPALLKTKQVAKTFTVCQQTVRRMILSGELAACKVGKHYRVYSDSVDVLLKKLPPAKQTLNN